MAIITLDIPIQNKKHILEYRSILSEISKKYSLQKLKEIKEKEFYINMLDWVFSENENFEEIKRNNWKLDFSELLK